MSARSHTDLEAEFERFLKAPWPLPDSQMSERKRLWMAFEAGAQWALDSVRAAHQNAVMDRIRSNLDVLDALDQPPSEAKSDEDVAK